MKVNYLQAEERHGDFMTVIREKYGKTYHMPPEVTYDWVKKDTIENPPVWCSVDLRDGNQAFP